ncbi:hypothetical protein [Actinocrinis puniceicyclus]|nr:hypothetical protein [Actinocrinis puniceicyclus]
MKAAEATHLGFERPDEPSSQPREGVKALRTGRPAACRVDS